MRLFCLPHAGGGAITYHSWVAKLPAFVQPCSVLLPGRETRLSEVLFTQFDTLLDAMDRELRPWLDIPFAVFGHSMGALLAFEWVRKLQRDGAAMPAWLFLSGRRAPDTPDDNHLLHPLPDSEFVKQLARVYDGIPQEFLENEALLEVFLPILRADIAVVESYRFQEGEPLDCPMTVFSGINDTSINWNQLRAWQRQTHRRRFAMQVFPGGHFYPHGPLLQSISATLTQLSSQSRSAAR
ncbi:MAG: thioesterase domain-containing protein [Terracidiphilus sp.]|jgi:medium-chain acyl-[acyl-carrier-protein] hydrolase